MGARSGPRDPGRRSADRPPCALPDLAPARTRRAAALLQTTPNHGRSFAVTQTHWFRMRDGLVIEHWANRDDLGMGLQLGWFGPPV